MMTVDLNKLTTRYVGSEKEAANDFATVSSMTVEQAIERGRRLHAEAFGKTIAYGVSRLKAAIGKAFVHWREAREDAKAIKELSALDDRTLADIGIAHRSQIAAVVYAARTDTRQTPVNLSLVADGETDDANETSRAA
ncbi:MAG: DUF1127 domain-containing protein [Pseudomonadota bacterium]